MSHLIAPETEEVTVRNDYQFPRVDLSNPNLPDLDAADVLPLDLMSDYWSPENLGESKRLIFVKLDVALVKDQATEEVVELPCAFFLEKSQEKVVQIRNGSRRLVGAIEAAGIQPGTPLLVTYLGKKNNRTNAYKSDNWSIKPLLIKI